MQLAANESFTNISSHSYQNKMGTIHVSVQTDDSHICMDFKDQGTPFSPSSIKDPNLQEHEGGLGLLLMKQIMDQWDYIPKHTLDGWNHLRMIKKIKEEN